MDNVAVNVSQPVISAFVSIGQSFVVEAQLMQQGCLQVVKVNTSLDWAIPKFIGRAISQTSLHTAAGKECTEAFLLMLSAVLFNR